MGLDERLKFGPYLTIYNKDYVKKKLQRLDTCLFNQIWQPVRTITGQEFKDPICEGFRNFLEVDKSDEIQPPSEACNEYLDKVKQEKPKIAQLFFENPIDRITVKGEQLLNGKSIYQVDYCDIEADIRRKLLETEKKRYELPDGWEIPLTTQKYDFRPPLVLSEYAMEKPLIIKQPNNLGQNEKMNAILNVKTGDSEYNQVIGKLGDFIVNEQMHGKIVHPQCGCLQHQQMK